MGDLNWDNYFAAILEEAKAIDVAKEKKKMDKSVDSVPEVRYCADVHKEDRWMYDVHDLLAKAAREYDIVRAELNKANEKLHAINKEVLLQVEREHAEEKRSHGLHLMSDAEYKLNQVFRQKHYEKCGNGNHFIYDLYGTGIGETIKVTCPKCGETMDITDTYSW